MWLSFIAFTALMLVLDLGVFQRHKHRPSLAEASWLSALWIALGLGFAGVIWLWGEEWGLVTTTASGQTLSETQTAVQYLTAYLIEKSLSMDNIFVWLLIFQYFQIPGKYQHEVLFWGILGAIVFRLLFILLGVALLSNFVWIFFVFGALLFYTGWKLFFHSGEQVDPEHNPVLKLLKKFLPVTTEINGEHFFIRNKGVLTATPLFVTLVVVETSDIVFAVDSVPAVLGVTRDLFIAFTSNVFAILGLRALYFVVAEMVRLFADLHYGLSIILIFVGAKMVYEGVAEYGHAYGVPHMPEWFHWASLGFVLGALGITMVISVLRHRGEPAPAQDT